MAITYGVSKQIQVTVNANETVRYCNFNNASTSSDSLIRLYSGNDHVFTLSDNKNNDEYMSSFVVLKNFVEFNWLTN